MAQDSLERKSQQTADRESRQMQGLETEGRSGYLGRDKEWWSGEEGRSGTR